MLQPIRLFTNFMTFIPSSTFTELRMVSVDVLQRMRHANRRLLPSRTPGPVLSWDLLVLRLLRLVFPSLSCLFLTFTPNYPLGTFSVLPLNCVVCCLGVFFQRLCQIFHFARNYSFCYIKLKSVYAIYYRMPRWYTWRKLCNDM